MSRFHPKPPDRPWLVPYIVLTDWIDNRRYYEKVFGFELAYVLDGPDGTPVHAEFRYNGQLLFMCAPEGAMGSPVRSPRSEGLDHSPVSFVVAVDDVDAFTMHALEAGGSMTAEPEDQFYGDRRVIFTDPSGYTWMFVSTIQVMSADEIAAAAAGRFS
jgi:PhnB protein